MKHVTSTDVISRSRRCGIMHCYRSDNQSTVAATADYLLRELIASLNHKALSSSSSAITYAPAQRGDNRTQSTVDYKTVIKTNKTRRLHSYKPQLNFFIFFHRRLRHHWTDLTDSRPDRFFANPFCFSFFSSRLSAVD